MKRRVRKGTECRWFIETFADKRNVTLFTMQSGIFIGFCDARFFLLELYEGAAIATRNEQKKSNDDYLRLCNTILFARALRLSRHSINSWTEATRGTAAASIEQLNMMTKSQWFDSDAYSIFEHENYCNEECKNSQNFQVLSQRWSVNRIRTATNITGEMSGKQSLAVKAPKLLIHQ